MIGDHGGLLHPGPIPTIACSAGSSTTERNILTGNAGDDRLTGVGGDELIGSAGDDIMVILAGAGTAQLLGGDGDDDLSGNSSSDHLSGGAGVDRLNGGWLHRDELAALVTPAYAVRLTDALDYAGVPAVRAHDGTRVLAGL
jgi:Ca2+-binding RTX toxin-like protein